MAGLVPAIHDFMVAIMQDVDACDKRGHDERSPSVPRNTIADRFAIRELIDTWAVTRDTGQWERFRAVWHDDGVMMATWFQGPVDGFIKASAESFARGVRAQHVLGGTSVEIRGRRAVAETRMEIKHRAPVEGVVCDVVCTGRFFDFLAKRKGRWGFVLRQPIYEQDRLDPVDGAARPALDAALLARFPSGYRHMAYLQARAGYDVKRDMPGAEGKELEALYARGKAWLQGSDAP
jgi:hypothetical protein